MSNICSRSLPELTHKTQAPVQLSDVEYDEETLQKLDATRVAITQVSTSDTFQSRILTYTLWSSRTLIWFIVTIGMGLGNSSVLQQVSSTQNLRHGTERSRSRESAS